MNKQNLAHKKNKKKLISWKTERTSGPEIFSQMNPKHSSEEVDRFGFFTHPNQTKELLFKKKKSQRMDQDDNRIKKKSPKRFHRLQTHVSTQLSQAQSYTMAGFNQGTQADKKGEK